MTRTEEKMAAEILRLEDERVTGPESLRITRLPQEDRGGTWEICGICDGIEPSTFREIKSLLDQGKREDAWKKCLQYILDNTVAVKRWLGASSFPALEFFLRDFCFNAGCTAAAKALQRAIVAGGYHLGIDGIVGKNTRNGMTLCLKVNGEQTLLNAVKYQRDQFYRNCKQFRTFGKGWLSRSKQAHQFALKLL